MEIISVNQLSNGNIVACVVVKDERFSIVHIGGKWNTEDKAIIKAIEDHPIFKEPPKRKVSTLAPSLCENDGAHKTKKRKR